MNQFQSFLYRLTRLFALSVYYGFAWYLPDSYNFLFGRISNSLRISLVKHIFKKTGKISTINRKAYFGTGKEVEIGDYSSIGANCFLPNNIKIGKYVMMGPELFVPNGNHQFADTAVPMSLQGFDFGEPTVIEDDCWIGRRCIITAGRHVAKGSIVAAGAVLTKDFEEYSIVGGNPAKLIRKRK